MKHCRKRPTIKPPLLKRKKTATNDLLNLKKQPKGKRKSSKHNVKGFEKSKKFQFTEAKERGIHNIKFVPSMERNY